MYSVLKRGIDFIVSIVMLIFVLPLLGLAALLIILSINEFPFFTQVRTGFKCTPFKVFKLKTMKRAKEGMDNSDQYRIFKMGSILRKLSIDELPQLLNIVLGQMSFVGPRPLMHEYLNLYSDHQLTRFRVKPGVTGLAQVKGRNSLKWSQKFKYDVFYVEKVNFCLDLKILLLTVKKVFNFGEVNTSGTVTAEKFDGTN